MAQNNINLKVISLNIRGINDLKKRRSVFRWLKRKGTDICFLQETYSTPSVVAYWKHQWSGQMFFSHGTNHARGTAILLKPGLDAKVEQLFCDEDGRVIIMSVTVQDSTFKMVNVYAPNNEHNRLNYFKYLKQKCCKYLKPNDKIIIGGDFNTILNYNLDKKGGTQTRSKTHRDIVNTLNSIKEELNLNETWRRKHPGEKRYTWNGMCGQRKLYSRLDIWFTSDSIYDFVEQVNIIPSILTDHSAIYLHIKTFEKEAKGKGYWRLNNSFLDEENYITGIRSGVGDWLTECEQFTDERMQWEYIKYKIRLFSMKYGKEKARHISNREDQLEQKLNELEQRLDESTSETEPEGLQREISEVTSELENINKYKTEGLILRSRCQWYEKGEKSNKYFLNLESRNKTRVTMTKLQKEDGTMTTDQKEILRLQQNFYQQLYSSQLTKTKEQIKEYLSNINTKTLSEDEKESCEGPLTNEECLRAVKSFKKNKSPGNDGLTAEFYLKMWPIIGNILVRAANVANQKGELSTSQKQAVITLLDKGKDRNQIKNWRPISLLNVDYKVISKALANRFITFLPQLIHVNQTGYIQDRNITENLRTISDILHYTKEENLPGLLVCIDFQKAFDSVEWDFLRQVLDKFNFGKSFTSWIKTLYSGVSSCITNNGHVSPNFNLGRGVRQGDPLSPYLFLLTAEILGCKVRQTRGIRGVIVNGKETKCLQYADDTVGVLKDLESAKQFLCVIEEFGKFSSLVLNKEKTEGLWIGNQRTSRSKPLGIRWPSEPLKILGVYFSYDTDNCNALNFEKKISKCKSILQMWGERNLTMQGRIQIIKTFIISQFMYTCSAIDIPHQFVSAVEAMIFKFIWRGKREKIKRSVLYHGYLTGGLRAPNFQTMISTSNIKWIVKIMNGKDSAWIEYLDFYAKRNGIDLKTLLCANYNVKDLPLKGMPNFYISALRDWSEVNQTTPVCKEQFLWYNKRLKIGGKPLFVKEMYHLGMKYVSDLYENETLRTFEYWTEKGLPKKFFLQWAGILAAIRESKLTKVSHNKEATELLCVDIPVQQINSKALYHALIKNKFGTEIIAPKIKHLFEDIEVDWSQVYHQALHVPPDVKTREFQYKFINDNLVNNYWLHKWKISDTNKCTFCNKETETLNHLFWQCEKVQFLWKKINDFTALKCNRRLSKQDIFLGMSDSTMWAIALCAKRYIYWARLNNESLSMNAFVKRLLTLIKMEEYISKQNGNLEKFVEKWELFL